MAHRVHGRWPRQEQELTGHDWTTSSPYAASFNHVTLSKDIRYPAPCRAGTDPATRGGSSMFPPLLTSHLKERYVMPRRRKTSQVVTTEDVTVAGVTQRVSVPAPVPRTPADWDRARSVGAMVITVVVVCGALAWSVYAIGNLLAIQAPAPLAYGIAVIFDLTWISALVREYELRYQPDRRKWLGAFSWILLGGSVTAVLLHGLRVADPTVAVCGAAIPLAAKIMWHMRINVGRRPMDARTRAWVDATYRDKDLATIATEVQRDVNRREARVAAERTALDMQRYMHPQVVLEGSSTYDDGASNAQADVPPRGERRRALAQILSQLPADDPRNQAQLARDYHAEVGMTEGSARNAIREWHEQGAAQ